MVWGRILTGATVVRRLAMVASGEMNSEDLQVLIEATRGVEMTFAEREAQRRSFVYGNTQIENERITREIVDRAAEAVARPARTVQRDSPGDEARRASGVDAARQFERAEDDHEAAVTE